MPQKNTKQKTSKKWKAPKKQQSVIQERLFRSGQNQKKIKIWREKLNYTIN